MNARAPGCLLVRAAGLRLGLPLDLVVEVIEPGEVLPVPSREPALRGVVNQRGHLVPVFELGALIQPGAARAGGVDGALVLAEVQGVRVGYLVDEADVVMHRGITFLPADESLPWARAIVGIPDNGYVPLVDLARLRTEAEGT